MNMTEIEEIDQETLEKAEAGDADAQNRLGTMYAQGVPKDYQKAFEW